MNMTLNTNRLSKIHCIIYRIFGCLLLGVSLINLIVIFHYFIKRYYNQKKSFVHNRLSPIMIGMAISSFLIIFTAEPLVVIQCFSCKPSLNDDLFCKMHGFICFGTGIFNIYIVALLSCLRYLSILHKSSWFNKFLEHHRDFSVLLCGIISICWSTPSLFNIGNKYIPESDGFYCSLRWNDTSIYSRIFIISILFFNYILPFFLVIYSNLRVWCILRYLLKIHHNLNLNLSTDNKIISIDLRKRLTDTQLKETINRLQKLKIDQRYAFITAILATQYLIVWSPYAFIVILQFTGQTGFIERHPFLPTLFALVAKIALILNPLILFYTSKMTHT
jgi:hypothetical protein